MASSRETNTMSEGLMRVLTEIMKMKTMPDGDLPFLVNLETEILQYMHAPMPQDTGMGGGPPPGMGGMGGIDPSMLGGMGGMPGGGAPPMPVPPPGTPASGGVPMPAMPNPDELRRVLQQ